MTQQDFLQVNRNHSFSPFPLIHQYCFSFILLIFVFFTGYDDEFSVRGKPNKLHFIEYSPANLTALYSNIKPYFIKGVVSKGYLNDSWCNIGLLRTMCKQKTKKKHYSYCSDLKPGPKHVSVSMRAQTPIADESPYLNVRLWGQAQGSWIDVITRWNPLSQKLSAFSKNFLIEATRLKDFHCNRYLDTIDYSLKHTLRQETNKKILLFRLDGLNQTDDQLRMTIMAVSVVPYSEYNPGSNKTKLAYWNNLFDKEVFVDVSNVFISMYWHFPIVFTKTHPDIYLSYFQYFFERITLETGGCEKKRAFLNEALNIFWLPVVSEEFSQMFVAKPKYCSVNVSVDVYCLNFSTFASRSYTVAKQWTQYLFVGTDGFFTLNFYTIYNTEAHFSWNIASNVCRSLEASLPTFRTNIEWLELLYFIKITPYLPQVIFIFTGSHTNKVEQSYLFPDLLSRRKVHKTDISQTRCVS